MCGIAGLWYTDESRVASEALVQRMLSRIVHRGPDDSGVWSEADQGVVLGQRRLAIIDLSPGGHQPMLSDDRSLAITFNGEIYNFKDLRSELSAKGIRFRSQSDTEVLLHAYQHWGVKMLDRLVGMFAFALWDVKQGQLFIARDRFGEKPLYYSRTSAGLAFSSEIASFREVPSVDHSPDATAVALYLHYQYVPAPHTCFRGVQKLSPGHAMLVTRKEQKIWRYWDPIDCARQTPSGLSLADAVGELETLLQRAVREQMVADVPVGAFLSGGIDSTTVVALMRKFSSSAIKTFTIGFETPENNEAPFAAAVAKQLGTEHHEELFTEKQLLALIPRLPEIYGEPFADPSALPTYLVSQVARQRVTVSLSGDGGDEIFGGYTRYHKFERLWGVLGKVGFAGALLAPLVGMLPGRIGRVGALLGQPMAGVYDPFVSVFDAAAVRGMTGRSPALVEMERLGASSLQLTARRYGMLTDVLSYMPECILVKVDRAAMRVSLETRAPFLDHRIYDFATRLSEECITNKQVLKEVAYRQAPKNLLDRPKQGFGLPLKRWFKGPLADLYRDTVTPQLLEGLGFSSSRIAFRLMDEHLAGKRDHSARLWSLLVLALWSRGAISPGSSVK